MPAGCGAFPIEQLFAKLKHWLRKVTKRSVDAVSNAIDRILDAITPDECRNYFAQATHPRRVIPL